MRGRERYSLARHLVVSHADVLQVGISTRAPSAEAPVHKHMCGILGVYNLPVSADQFSAMSTAIAHRGPDAAGSYEHEGPGYRVSLGHRRLSIIDLSEAANQPFVKDGLALVFCGEIYNYRALRH